MNFDQEKWLIKDSPENYPSRDTMVDDIITNKLFIGVSYQTLVDTLGNPENIHDAEPFDAELAFSV